MKSILSAVVGATLALAPVHARADGRSGEREVAIEIESKTLAGALDQWAQQSGYQIFLQNWKLAKSLTARSVKGTYSAEAALAALLEGTPLTYMWINDRSVAIRERSSASAWQTVESSHDYSQVAKLSGDDRKEQWVAADESAQSGSEVTDQRVARSAGPEVKDFEEIVVTGTYIHGVQNNTVPTVVMDKDYIASTGLSTSTRLMESLPQNFALSSPAGVGVPGVTSSETQGSSINLRGIGEGTTLTLVNGRRMASTNGGSSVDISALPLSAIERVEVLTDGASALYGSDAVGGVVNFILRRDFSGAETRVSGGWGDGGPQEFRASQAVGHAWDSGNALLSMEYYKRDLLRANERDFVPSASDVGSLYPEDTNYSGVFSARQELTDTVSVFADALYSKRDSYNEGGQTSIDQRFETDNDQHTVTLGAGWKMGEEWQLETSGSHAESRLDSIGRDSVDPRGALSGHNRFEIKSARIVADGPVLDLYGGRMRAAIGADWRSELFRFSSAFQNGELGSSSAADQNVRSAFAELYIPLIGTHNDVTAARRLEVSLAGRYDDYSTFGSSVDPRVGVMWEPLDGLRIRGSWGTSYVAPRLSDYDAGGVIALALMDVDPESPTGVSRQLQVYGTDVASLAAQESESSSFGIEVTPSALPALQLNLNYYRIEYKNRISNLPFASVMLGDPASFQGLFVRNPTVAEVNSAIAIGQSGRGFLPLNPDFTPDENFDPATIDVIVEQRRRNLSRVDTSGMDLSMQYRVSTAEADLLLGVSGTYILGIEQQVTSTSPAFDVVDTFYNPPKWRARGFAEWRRQAWAASIFVNHTDSYVDNRGAVDAPISAYTTVDGRVAYDFDQRSSRGFLSGVTASFNVQNAFDQDPPRAVVADSSRDMGFDPTNASPLGRFFVIEVTKNW
jgi:iron complex outermembrane recepter protein